MIKRRCCCNGSSRDDTCCAYCRGNLLRTVFSDFLQDGPYYNPIYWTSAGRPPVPAEANVDLNLYPSFLSSDYIQTGETCTNEIYLFGPRPRRIVNGGPFGDGEVKKYQIDYTITGDCMKYVYAGPGQGLTATAYPELYFSDSRYYSSNNYGLYSYFHTPIRRFTVQAFAYMSHTIVKNPTIVKKTYDLRDYDYEYFVPINPPISTETIFTSPNPSNYYVIDHCSMYSYIRFLVDYLGVTGYHIYEHGSKSVLGMPTLLVDGNCCIPTSLSEGGALESSDDSFSYFGVTSGIYGGIYCLSDSGNSSGWGFYHYTANGRTDKITSTASINGTVERVCG